MHYTVDTEEFDEKERRARELPFTHRAYLYRVRNGERVRLLSQLGTSQREAIAKLGRVIEEGYALREASPKERDAMLEAVTAALSEAGRGEEVGVK